MVKFAVVSAKAFLPRFISFILILSILGIIIFLDYGETKIHHSFERGFNPIYSESEFDDPEDGADPINSPEEYGGSKNEVNNTVNVEGAIPVTKTANYRIIINLDEYQMFVYKDGELFKKYPVSGGSTRTPSPIGTWKIIGKDTWGEGFGGAWMGLNVPWGKYGIHGTYSPWDAGKVNASGGCIRMKNDDVRELYTYIPYGTTVTIIQDNLPLRIISNGDFGSDVYNIQKMLKKLGYYKGYVDGTYGHGTDTAVEKFQKDFNLHVDKIVYKNTYDTLKKAYEEKLKNEPSEINSKDLNQTTKKPESANTPNPES